MRLRYMELHNYRKFRSAAVEFPDGVVAIVGQNGAGKTTLIEAVTWALFGNESSVVRDGKDGIMSASAAPGEECSVELEFDLGEDSYRLARSMKGKGLKVDASLEVNGNVVATGDTDVTRSMVSRLGMDHKAFFVSVFAKQKDLNALASLKPAERKTLVLRMLGVDFLDDVIRNVDRDAKTAKREAEQLSALLRDDQGRDKEELLRAEERRNLDLSLNAREEHSRLTAERQQAADASRTAHALWEAEEERYRRDVALERRLTGLRAGLQAKRASMDRLDKEIAELDGLRASLPQLERGEAEYQRCRADLERHAALRERHLRRRRSEEEMEAREKDLAILQGELEEARSELSRLPDTEASLARVEESLEEARSASSALHSQLGLAEAESKRLRDSAEEARRKGEEIAELGEESNCPTCLRRLGRQYSDLLRRYAEEAEKALEGGRALEATVSSLREQRERNEARKRALEERRQKVLVQSRSRASLEERARKAGLSITAGRERLESLRAELEAMGPVPYDEVAHDRERKLLAELEPAHLALSRAQARMERLPETLREREGLALSAGEEGEEADRLAAERSKLGFDMRGLQARRKEHEESRGAEEELARKVIRTEGELARLASEMESLSKRFAELRGVKDRHASLMREQETLHALAQVMKGFKENVISRIVPTLSETSSDLLTQLTDGKYGGMRLDDEYQMYLYDQGQEHRLERFSGGETDLANLCLRLAISRMIMERSDSQMNFLVLDEIFGSQDQTRKRNILETLGQLQRQFRQILLITHIDDVKDNVGSVIRVEEKEDGSSTVALED